MAIIDADAHVIETDHTWDYMRSEDEGVPAADRGDD